MKTKYLIGSALIVPVVALLSGCAPATFVRTSLATWKVVEFRPGIERDEAYNRVADTIAKNYDIEVIDKDSGYIRTAWMFTTTGKVRENYRTKVVAKIPASNDKVEIKTEAHWYDPVRESWVMGLDTALLEQVYQDIQGTVGRVSR